MDFATCRVHLNAGQTINLGTCGKGLPAGASGTGDTFLRLYRVSTGTEVAWNDNSNCVPTKDFLGHDGQCRGFADDNCDLLSHIRYTANQSDDYEIRQGCSWYGTCSGQVTFSISNALPDLVLVPHYSNPLGDMVSGITLAQKSFTQNDCAVKERCIDKPGFRRLLLFAVATANFGVADLVLGSVPQGPGVMTHPDFEWASCHGHYHYRGYGIYELLDSSGTKVAAGHKQGFCLPDEQIFKSSIAPPNQRYTCGYQGAQPGWGDVYQAFLRQGEVRGNDCNWIDVTDVAPGSYILRIRINPDRTIPESDYSNNEFTYPVKVQ
jgi:hypothetical protein